VKAELVQGASVRVKGAPMPNLATNPDAGSGLAEALKPDETRMFVQAAEASGMSRSAKLEATRERLPALSTPLDLEVPVPEPKLPGRVRLARWLIRFFEEAKLSWRTHRRRWILALATVGTLFIAAVGWAAGLPQWIGGMVGGAADRAREIRRSAGLDKEVVDAGLRPTVLKLASQPPGALVSIDGIGAGCVTPCELPEPPVGVEIQVELSLDGYRPRIETLTLRPHDGTHEISVVLERAFGGVRIESDPPGAVVTVDGRRLKGTTPLTLDGLKAGKPVNVEVRKSGFLPRRWVVIPRDGQLGVEAVTLEVDVATIPPGRIEVRTRPSNCAVRIDGSSAGTSPVSGYEVKRGQHTVEVECAYHAPETRTVQVEPGKSTKVEITSTPNVFGYLTLRIMPPGGNVVTVNGLRVDPPIEFKKVVPGRHVVEVKNTGLDRTKTMTIDIGPDKRITREINLYQ
jgi:hypothetical protein